MVEMILDLSALVAGGGGKDPLGAWALQPSPNNLIGNDG